MREILSATITLALFISCNSSMDKRVGTDTSSNQKESKAALVIDKTPQTFKGLFKYEDGTSTFRDCNNSGKTYLVRNSSDSISQAYKKATKFLTYPGETVYAEIKGYLAGKSTSQSAVGYDNELIITSVDKLEQKNYKIFCYDFEFIALGNEPFWSIDIIPTEQKIVLKNVGSDKVYIFPYRPANVVGSVYRFKTKTKNDTLVILIKKEKCSDGMSGRSYNFSAEIAINGETLKGCAIKKGDLVK